MTSRAGITLVVLAAISAFGAGWLAPHRANDRFDDLLYAPPTSVHVRDAAGRWRAPFIYRQQLTNRLERTFAEDRSQRVPLQWVTNGRLVTTTDATAAVRASDAAIICVGTPTRAN